MIKLIITILLLLTVSVFVSVGFSQTPIPGSPDEAYNLIISQADLEFWVETNYDPVETRRGVCICPKDVIFQSATLELAVICTYGYENIYYEGESGDIRGLNCQGFIDIEGTVVAFRLEDIFVSNCFAGDKWKKVKAIKIKSYPQTKSAHPKKEKWKTSNGLKEKKEKFAGGGS